MRTATDGNPFASAVTDANRWLDEICADLSVDRRQALHALKGALHVLRDRLTPEQNAHLSAQFPTLIRGIYYEGWRPGELEHATRNLDLFLEQLAVNVGLREDLDAFEVARAVYALLGRHISEGEERKITAALPHQLRELWKGV